MILQKVLGMRRALLVVLPLPMLLVACRDKKPEPAPVPIVETAAPVIDAGVLDSSQGSQPTRAGPAPVPMEHFDASRFLMGTESNVVGADVRDEQPIHSVEVPAFWLDVEEVTVTAYRACVEAGACTTDGLGPEPKDGNREACNWNQPGYEKDPINCVTWDQAAAYCRWAGKELPTEEMWEYAARGPKRRDFPWGMGIPGHSWGLPDGEEAYVRAGCDYAIRLENPERVYRARPTCPVGHRPKADTPEGVKDMASNVQEWTASPFCPYKDPKCGTRERAIRGGYNAAHPSWFRAAVRTGAEPATRYDFLGFRCARPDTR